MKNIRFVIAIAAGKGGVGKSSVTTLLSQFLAKQGYEVGVLDADLYGPSLAQMMPLDVRPNIQQDVWSPGLSKGIKVFSFAQNVENFSVRAPVINACLLEAIHKIQWGDLDYLLIDFPPGTGDTALTLLQNIYFSGAVLVTLPQQVSAVEVKRSAGMFSSLAVPIIGVIENMSYWDENNKRISPFGRGGGAKLCEELQVPLLGELPLDPSMCRCLDQGRDYIEENGDSALTCEIGHIGKKIVKFCCSSPSLLSIEDILYREKDWYIQWSDGMVHKVDPYQLQKCCPCLRCKEGEGIEVKKDVSIQKIHRVGAYAVKVDFSSGCKKGLFPFEMLRHVALEGCM